jgi:hypothetical protein
VRLRQSHTRLKPRVRPTACSLRSARTARWPQSRCRSPATTSATWRDLRRSMSIAPAEPLVARFTHSRSASLRGLATAAKTTPPASQSRRRRADHSVTAEKLSEFCQSREQKMHSARRDSQIPTLPVEIPVRRSGASRGAAGRFDCLRPVADSVSLSLALMKTCCSGCVLRAARGNARRRLVGRLGSVVGPGVSGTGSASRQSAAAGNCQRGRTELGRVR